MWICINTSENQNKNRKYWLGNKYDKKDVKSFVLPVQKSSLLSQWEWSKSHKKNKSSQQKVKFCHTIETYHQDNENIAPRSWLSYSSWPKSRNPRGNKLFRSALEIRSNYIVNITDKPFCYVQRILRIEGLKQTVRNQQLSNNQVTTNEINWKLFYMWRNTW